jgi:hypothetical protein
MVSGFDAGCPVFAAPSRLIRMDRRRGSIMTRTISTQWQIPGALLTAALLGGCDAPAAAADDSLDERLAALLQRIEDPRSYTDDDEALALLGDLDALSADDEALLVAAIDARYGEATAFRDKKASIPVSWASWPSGKIASASGITTECDGDQDVWLRYSDVPGAFASPGSLRIQTNSVYVYGAMAVHDYLANAYKITPGNTVNICIGAGPFLGPAVQGALIAGFFLK